MSRPGSPMLLEEVPHGRDRVTRTVTVRFHIGPGIGDLPGIEGGDETRVHLVRQLHLEPLGHLLDDPQSRGEIGRLDAAHQPAGEPRDQLGPQLRQIGRRAVGGEDKLPSFSQERVDRGGRGAAHNALGPPSGSGTIAIEAAQIACGRGRDVPILAQHQAILIQLLNARQHGFHR